ncbi:MAG: hypothetical protein U0L98_02555 [Clostridia bacterium]|nr:hypothetical protein [Clostridia bacterium]
MGESKEDNDLFFTCSLIEYIARKTKNTKKEIVNKLGYEKIKKIFDLAEVYHSENIDKVADEFINNCKIEQGNYDVIAETENRIPTYWEIGRVYQRLIKMVNSNTNEYINTTIEVLSSWIIEKIDNYNSSMYYENPDYIYNCYKEGYVL